MGYAIKSSLGTITDRRLQTYIRPFVRPSLLSVSNVGRIAVPLPQKYLTVSKPYATRER
jgi:hypothetical protein